MRTSFLLLLLAATFGCTSPTPEPKPTLKRSPWSEVIFYQIFPERFQNGDPSNDPTLDDMRGSWPFMYMEDSLIEQVGANWQVSPWHSDWYELQPWEENIPWEASFDWYNPDGPVINLVGGIRRYGGDLQGIIDKLDYLQELGINAIYLNPVFEAYSNHKYDATMFHHVDNKFGPDPAGDAALWLKEDSGDPETWKWTAADKLFLELIQQCHQRGMRIVIDGVFNHTGIHFWAFQDVLENQADSPYKDWYTIRQFDDPSTPENEFDYAGWIGIKDLPEFKEDSMGLVEGPRQHVHQVVKRWMDPNGDGDPSDGIDGWRLDVAEMVDIDFWKTFRGWVKEINPDAYITGEIWWEDWNENEMHNAAPWLECCFDGVMNYRFGRALKQFVADQEWQIGPAAFADSLQTLYEQYPWERVLTCQNLMDSHDIDRISSQVVNPDRAMDHQADPYSNPNYKIRKPNAEEWQKVRLIAGLQMTLPGAPMVYYGTEAGMWGSDDPDCRKPMVWPDRDYQLEAHDEYGQPRPADSVYFDRSMFDWYQQLISLRKKHPVLADGMITFDVLDEEAMVLGYKRYDAEEDLLVLINNKPKEAAIFVPANLFSPEGKLVDLLSKRTFTLTNTMEAGGGATVDLAAYGIAVLEHQR